MSISNYLENELLDHIFNAAYTNVATVYVALSTADPLDDASGMAEPVGNNYAREAITFSAASSRVITQSGDITFNTASGSWGTISHYAIYDAATSGNMLAHGSLNASKSVVNGNTPSIATTEITITFSAGEISDYCADALLDFAFRNQAFSAPDTYVALCTATISDSDTGSTITEPAGNGYARKQVNVNGGASPTWDLAASGALDNTHDIEMATPSGSWGTIVSMAIIDAATTGNMLFYDNGVSDQAVGSGDTVKFNAGELDVALS